MVSAIITTHNRIDLLKRAIQSIKDQTYKDIELIVVDDKSNDGTKEYCESLSDIRYIYISPEESKGGNYARNKGILASNGEYIAFLDDDDYWLPQKIEKQMELMLSTNCTLVHCGRRFEYINSDGSTTYEDRTPTERDRGDLSKRILLSVCTTTTCMLTRRDTLIIAGLFDESLGFWQEYELSIRLAQIGDFQFVAEPLAVYRVDTRDKGRLTNKYTPWLKAVKQIYDKHKSLYSQLSFKERLGSKSFFYSDAEKRCKAAGLKHKALIYKAKRVINKFLRVIL